MKKGLQIIIGVVMAVLISCKDNDVSVFDKTSDERAAEAIAALKSDLVAPADGWKIKYRPESASGSFFLLLDFNDDNTVTIKSDLGANDGEFHEQTMTYRIDNSLGLELIIESYSFFSYLFEQDNATFEAEYEFRYVNKTPDNALVFRSKTDNSTPSLLVFEEAGANDDELLGIDLSNNLNVMADDIDRFSSAYKLTYEDKDLVFYLSLDPFRRTARINTAAKKTNAATTKTIDFTTGYLLLKDSIVFDEALSGSFVGTSVTLKSIKLASLSDAALNVCAAPIPTHAYSGVTSTNNDVILEPSIIDANGKKFATLSDFYYSPTFYIFHNGEPQNEAVEGNITGVQSMQLYYNFDIGSRMLFGLGFFILNADGSRTFALREFTPTLNNNNIIFNFEPGITLLENENPDANINIENINIYVEALTEGGHTYVHEYSENIFEFYNPCNGWSVVFLNPG
jgi:hypothetical protein